MTPFIELTKSEQIERWENVLRVLNALTPHQREKHFDMNRWGLQTACGTVACAAGHCSLDPWFSERGLKPTLLHGDTHDTEYQFTAYFDGDEFEELVCRFFGEDGTNSIFMNWQERSADAVSEEVAAYIKRLKSA